VPRPGRRLVAAAAAGALIGSGCGGAHHQAAPPRPPVSQPAATVSPAPTPGPVGELSFALDSVAPQNWNVLAAGGNSAALDQIATLLWPSAFVVGSTYVPTLNTALLSSATMTSESPQVVVYHINPSAMWSDGTPITGQDFVYNWEAQSGQRRRGDLGGRPFTPVNTAGYSQIGSVEVAPLAPDVVTVRFSTPDPDWRSLFSDLIPAHVAEQIGFDSGFSDPVADLVSGGPYVVQSYIPGTQLRLVRNPSFSGPPGPALALDYDFLPYSPQMLAALSTDEVSCADVPANPATLLPLMRGKTAAVKVAGGSSYLDLDFREGTDALAAMSRRQAIVEALNRQTLTAMVVGSVLPGAAPVGNRFFVPGEPGYAADASPQPAAAPVSYRGPPLRLVAGPDAYSTAAARSVVSQLAAHGIDVTVETVSSLSRVLAGSNWDMAVEVRTVTPFPGPATLAYAFGASSDVDGVDSVQLNALVERAASTTGAARTAVLAEIDRTAWHDAIDLPLFAIPIAVACQPSVVSLAPNPTPSGPAYENLVWGLAGSAA
jgi:peptide/nickel transport system substrate-binding protein